jgi:RNA polymerase sigma factor (TIGR02999 family)
MAPRKEKRNLGMNPVTAHTVTELLVSWERGNADALDRLAPLVHGELRRLARRHMQRELAGHTLQATALINEAYLRLIEPSRVSWQNRAHFFAVASRLMRHILVDHARAKRNWKRGGNLVRVPLTDGVALTAPLSDDVLALHDALTRLAAIDPRRSRVVELRVFGGLTADDTARVLRISVETVMRDWRLARAWLRRELTKINDDRTS